MEHKNRYYLYRMGRMVGPVSEQRIEEMRKTKEIFRHMWIMSEKDQKWVAIDEMPSENPFHVTESALKERVLSGAFVMRTNAISGVVKGIHSFGVELLVKSSKLIQIAENSLHVLNLIDETNLKASNAEVVYSGQEILPEGTLLRFAWREGPSAL